MQYTYEMAFEFDELKKKYNILEEKLKDLESKILKLTENIS